MEMTLVNPAQGRVALTNVFKQALVRLNDGHRLVVEVRDETRTAEQNKLLHALLGEISKRVKWDGQFHDITVWKRLLTAAWLRAEGNSPTILRSLDGHGLEVIYEPTSKMTKSQLNSLIEYVQAWSAENLPQEILGPVDPETGEIMV